MIRVYTWPTANCLKVHIALEELALPYETSPVNVVIGAHRAPEFRALDPNCRVPIIRDSAGPDGAPIVVADSNAILIYLAEKTARLLPRDPAGRSDAIQWLAFQAGGLNTFGGEATYYRNRAPEQWPYAIMRYTNEARRHFQVLETRMAARDFIAGEYSIADISMLPWLHIAASLGQDIRDFPNCARWYLSLLQRPAVQRAIDALRPVPSPAEGAGAPFSYAPLEFEKAAP